MHVLGVIPARYQSTRFPGKPLADICGKPMIWWVYNRVQKASKLDSVYVATDDERISGVCKEFSIPFIMTKSTHMTSTNRVCEVAQNIEADYYVQINGDEPLINIEAVNAAVPEYVQQDTAFGTNIITEMTEPSQVIDSSNIKVVFDKDFRCAYMSRTPIPYPNKSIDFKYYKHVGIIGYNKKMLELYENTTPGQFERIEGIDTLRFIDYGKRLNLIYIPECHSLSVDTPKDLDEVKRIISNCTK